MESPDVQDLELVSIIGFDGNAPKGLRAHPDGVHIVYPFGIKLAVQNMETKAQSFMEGHNNVISCVAISDSGKYIASGQINHMGFKAPVIVWSFETKKPVFQHDSHKVRVESVLFSSCETFIISLGGRDDANVCVFNFHTKEAICGTFSSNRNAGDAVTLGAMNLRGPCFITGGVSTLKVWTLNPKARSVRGVDVAMGKIRRKITCIEITSNDEYAYCGTSTGDVMKVKLPWSPDLNILDPIAPPALIGCYGKIPKKKKNMQPDMYSLGVRAILLLCGNKLLIGAGDGTIDLVEERPPLFDTHNKSLKIAQPTHPSFATISSTSVNAFVTSLQLLKTQILVGTIKCEMFVIDMRTFALKLLITCHTSPIFDVAFPSDYSDVFATASKDDVRVWSVSKAKELLRIVVPNFTCSGLLFSYDGRCIATSWNDGNIRAFTPQTGKLIFTVYNAHNKGVSALAMTKNGKKMLSGGVEGQVRIWDVKKDYQKLIAVLKEHKGPVSSIDVAPNDKEAASASTDGTCIIWDLENCVRVAILFSSTLFMCVRYHPSGCQLLTCGTNRQLGYWEVFDGSLIREIEGSLSAALNSLDITTDGTHVVTGGNDMYVKVWLYKEGYATHVGVGHGAVITAVRISADKRTIVSCSADGAIFIWKAPFGERRISQLREKASQPSRVPGEKINAISPDQNITAVSNLPIPTQQEKKQSSGPNSKPTSPKGPGLNNQAGDHAQTEGGAIKCYCVSNCHCKGEDLPKMPTPRNENKGNRPQGNERNILDGDDKTVAQLSY